jgi:hypothetical protein
MDTGDMEKAEEMRSLFEETNPEFRYFADVKEDIEELKKQVTQNTKDIEVLNKSGGRVVNAQTLNELWINIANPLTSYEDRKIYMTSIMKFETYEIEKILPEFKNVCIMPAGLEIYDQSEDVYSRDLEYLTDLLSEKDINTRPVSYYAYYYLRAIPTEHIRQVVPKVIEVCELLEEFNKKNRIEEYDLEVFGGSYAFYFNRGGDLNLSVQHLIELLKGEM